VTSSVHLREYRARCCEASNSEFENMRFIFGAVRSPATYARKGSADK